MKELPEFMKARQEMEPGRLTREGFLGEDSRSIDEIVSADLATASRLGVELSHLASRLDSLTSLAIEALGAPVKSETFCISAIEGLGKIPCPFDHHGLYSKAVICAENSVTRQELTWSALSVHMLLEHNFCGGHGSPYRIEVEEIVLFFGEPCLTNQHEEDGQSRF